MVAGGLDETYAESGGVLDCSKTISGGGGCKLDALF